MIVTSCSGLNFTKLRFPEELASRGFFREADPGGASDPGISFKLLQFASVDLNVVPGYLYRDYGFMVWDALSEYVKTVVTMDFKKDEDVRL